MEEPAFTAIRKLRKDENQLGALLSYSVVKPDFPYSIFVLCLKELLLLCEEFRRLYVLTLSRFGNSFGNKIVPLRGSE